MPRPKSELTKSGKAIGIRVTQSEYEEYIKLGGGTWLRRMLQDRRDNKESLALQRYLNKTLGTHLSESTQEC
jgi:hypothetical protein